MAKNLLNQSGVIFQSIDDNEQARLKLLSDGIFGEQNFVSELTIIVKPEGRRYGHFAKTHEFAYVYSKNSNYLTLNEILAEGAEHKYFDGQGGFSLKGLRNRNVQAFNSTNRPNLRYPFFVDEASADSNGFMKVSTIPKNDFVKVEASVINGLESVWRWGKEKSERENSSLLAYKGNDGEIRIFQKERNLTQTAKTVLSNKDFISNKGTKEIQDLFGKSLFGFPKPMKLINLFCEIGSSETDLILDYFAGSGTTAHAVINLNREDNGKRKYILVEQGEYFDTVLKPRVQKVIFAKDWKDGKPQADNGEFGGVSQIVKVLNLESYEDTLNNLELKQPASDLFAQNDALQNDYLLHYMLDIESRDSLLNTQHFTKPFDYQLNIATTSSGAYEAKTIDLVETFNYLIGLRVSEINDKRENGLVTVQGTNTSGEKTLVIWRDCEKYDYDKLNDYLNRHKINPQESEFDVVYINGDHNVPTVFAGSDESIKMLKVRSIEAEFLSKMFG